MKPATIHTPSDTTVEVSRSFDAPVESVWKPFTDAGLVRLWMLGPPGSSMPICEMDFRLGGTYETVFRNEADGSEIAMVGDFREIETYRKIVQDERHVIGGQGTSQETVVTLTFEPTERRTTVTTLIEYASEKARDEALATGMAPAMERGYCRIDELLIRESPRAT
ncbi:MAG: SRPBCC domain-containing protein [Planctomycetota bacterium]